MYDNENRKCPVTPNPVCSDPANPLPSWLSVYSIFTVMPADLSLNPDGL
jgi:hypothetical protein